MARRPLLSLTVLPASGARRGAPWLRTRVLKLLCWLLCELGAATGLALGPDVRDTAAPAS